MNLSEARKRMEQAIKTVKKVGLKDVLDQKYKGEVLKKQLDDLKTIQHVLNQMNTKEWKVLVKRQEARTSATQAALF